MASRTRVVLDLVGPYTLYGKPVIEACVANGAHYVDLTGEIPFVRRMIDAFDDRASEAGVKVVEVCGFEALPPDLAVLLAAETARERWEEDLAEADVAVSTQQPAGKVGLADMMSGGTMQSMAEVFAAEGAAESADPATLIADPELAAKVRDASPIELAPRFAADGVVIAPMSPAAFINPAVIHRTAALLAEERGSPPSRSATGRESRSRARRPACRCATGRRPRWPGCRPASRRWPGPSPRHAGGAPATCARSSPARASGRRALAWRSGAGSSPSTPAPMAATTSASTSTPTATPAT